MALVVQGTGARQGNANTAFYPLASRQRVGGAAVFHDITSGSNSVPGQSGFTAGAGYDQATGLGSVDASMLVSHWGDASIVPVFQAVLAANSLSVTAGSNNSVSVNVTVSGGFYAPVSFSVTGLPAGVSGGFTAAALSAPGSGSSVLKLTAVSTAKPGVYPVTVTASSGATKHTASLSVTVATVPSFVLATSVSSISVTAGGSKTLTLTTTPNAGFNAAITFTVTGLPAGVTAQFLPASMVAAPGAGTTTVTFSAAAGVPAKSHAIVLVASGGGLTQKQTVTMNVPGLTLTPSVSSVTVSGTVKGTFKVTTAVLGGFNSPISFSVSGLPSGVSASLSLKTVSAPGSGSSTITVTKAAGAAAGSSHFTVIATGTSVVQSQSIGLTVK
jgi:hypothetical protein